MLKKDVILQKLGQLVLHVLFWLAVLFFFTYFFGAENQNYGDTLSFSLFLMPITIATTYVSIYKLIPDYLITKRYFLFIIYSLYALIISGYLIMVSVFFSLIYLANFEYDAMNPATKNILLVTTGVYLVTIIVSAFKLLKLNLRHVEQKNKLENKIFLLVCFNNIISLLFELVQYLNYLNHQLYRGPPR